MSAGERVESDGVSRRDCLSWASTASATVSVLFATIGMLRLPRPRVSPDVSTLIRLGKPTQFAAGSSTMLPQQKVCVIASDEGVGAISLVCTHLGCVVNKSEHGFDCPCHGSKFGPAGELVQGPAPRGLPWLAVSQAPDGTLLVDTAKQVSPQTLFKA